MILPSTAITLRPQVVPVRVHNHDAKWASRPAGSISWSTLRIVDSDARARPSGRPRASSSAAARSVARSHIAVRLRQLASPR